MPLLSVFLAGDAHAAWAHKYGQEHEFFHGIDMKLVHVVRVKHAFT